MSEEKQFVPVVLDREISSREADAFGHRHYALLLQDLIESLRNEPPYSIGLLGRWGSGKSSIKSLYLHSLSDDAASSAQKPARSKRIKSITFNAWRFGGEDIKRALLRLVYLELGGDKEKLDEALFKQIQRSQPEKRSWSAIFKDAFEELGTRLIQVVLVFGLLVGFMVLSARLLNITNQVAISSLIGVAAVVAGAIVKFLLDATPTRHATITRVDPPHSTAEQYEDFLLEQLRGFKREHKSCERLVIFVDDLDRLSPEEMIGGLDAVRTFMEIPKKHLPADLGIVFVISCDEDRIAEALADKRRRIGNSDLPGAVFTQADAHRFLDRIFQFRLDIPPFPKRDMRNYAQVQLLKAFPALTEELKALSVSIETLVDRMIHVDVGTPRNALQIVNAFMQAWWLAKRRERDGAGTEVPGGLQEGSVTKHPLALGAICALRVDFPDFHHELQRDPELIVRFTDVFVRGLSLTEQPESLRPRLLRFAEKTENESTLAIRPEHRPLRQYIASLQGLRWPKAMRPLLFLSEDPVSRKFGDRAAAIHGAFISGDHTGVLSLLGREHDAKPLSEPDMRLLHEMVEDLNSETEIRQNNAAAVLAALGPRYPRESAHLLLTPLARRLAEAPELRWRLGLANIGKILTPIAADDRRDVASCLVDDLLRTDGEIDFRLASGEHPSLDEAMDMVRGACSLVLDVQRTDRLNDRRKESLLNWLESRRVAVAGREQSLSFVEFESWIAEHEAWLLPALGGRYTQLIIEKLEMEGPSGLALDEVVRRSRLVFATLYDSGEDSRTELWQQLTRLVANGEPPFVVVASEFVKNHVGAPNEAAISTFVTTFAKWLLEESQPEARGDFDLLLQAGIIVEIATKRLADLQPSCASALSGLVRVHRKITSGFVNGGYAGHEAPNPSR